jgi:RimJ/RimL family protein N-acetyltransferase
MDMVVHHRAIQLRLRSERPWREHERLYTGLFGDPAVAATLWPGARGGARTSTQAAEILSADIAHWREDGFGPWVFFEAATGLFVGRGGLCRTTFGGRDCVEVLYAVRSEVWGRGYATEMAHVSVAHGRRLGLTDIVGFTLTTNVASRRVLEKTGMRIERQRFEHAGFPHLLGRLLPNS